MAATHSDQKVNEAIVRARLYSPFLKLQLEAQPRLAATLERHGVGPALEWSREAGNGAPDAGSALRRERNALALTLAIGDLGGLLGLEEVMGELSAFADRAIEEAVAHAIQERTPGEAGGFAVMALGKLGSRELNYSSDVDLIFLFDPKRLPLKPREEPGQAALRIGNRVIELLQKRDAEGYVFRVDLRLRPSPEVTPIALPVDAAISYYEASALPWERAAFVRARAVAGDAELSRYFLDAIHPFVWRRSLDFGAIQELQAISRRIRDHYSEVQRFGPGFDVKRGRGGIREIEFFAQIHQLIHGGRDPALRAPATLDAVRALAAAGHVTAKEGEGLAKAYRLFRTIEHRLQMVEDRQTHQLPADRPALDNVARLHGLVDGEELLGLLEPEAGAVALLYDRLRNEDGERLPVGVDALEAHLARAGFRDAAATRSRIEGWRTGKVRSLRSAASQEAFEAMLPALIEAFGAAPDPMAALNRFDDLVTRLPSGVNFYRLLQARSSLTQHLATLLSHAPALAEQLGRRPELLEGLIDESAFTPPPSVDELELELLRSERPGEDYQLLLDRVRRRVNERRFALGVQLIVGDSDPMEVAGGYARVAEAAVRVLARATIAEFEAVHGRVAGSELLILGLGRLGGKALTHASDLDLVYLFAGTHEGVSDGPKPLRASDYFNRLAPRVTAALSVPTAAGPLYNVDTRLRPSGKDGLIAVSLPSFEEYQHERAWTWEHMALTRARPVFGSENGREELCRIIEQALLKPRDPETLRTDVVSMRTEIATHKPPKGPFDLKLGDGGLVDLEFAVHLLQLRHGVALRPSLEEAIGALVEAGLVPPEIDEAHRLLTRMLVVLRLVSPNSAEPPPASRHLVAKVCGRSDWNDLLAAHDDARHRVAKLWRDVSAA
jgi:glutamate-ammonia-ligase adenylyltransferase